MTQFTFPANVDDFIDTGIFIKTDGSRVLTGDWDIGAKRKIQAEAIWARSIAGLALYEDGGAGIFVQDGGNVGIGTATPDARLSVFNNALDMNLGSSFYNISSQLTTIGNCIGTSNIAGNNLVVTNNANAGAYNFNLFGVQCRVNNPVGYLCTSSFGGLFTTYNTHTLGTMTSSTGGYFGVTLNGAGGTITNVTGGQFTLVCPAGTMGTAYGASISITGAGTITTAYGLYIGTITGTAKWSLYADDANSPSYFAGNMGINTTSPSAKLDINSDILRLRTAKTPTSAGASGNAGDICWDSNYIYVCVASNTWKRAAVSTWS